MSKLATITLVFLLFTLTQCNYQTQLSNYGTITEDTSDPIFENDFEEGNFSAWTKTHVYQGQSFTCVTATNESTSPHHGIYQAKAVINGSLLSASAYAYKDLLANYTTINLRFYVYLSTYYAPTQPHETYLGTIASDTGILCQIGLTETTGELVFILHHAGGVLILFSTITLSPNTWHCIEIQRIQHPENGEYHVWLNDIEITEFSRTNLNTSRYTANRIYIGNYHGCAYHSPNQVIFYMDCVAVSNTYVGRE